MSLENVDLRWRRLSLPDPAPCARSHHSAAAIGSKLYIFGGKDANGTVLNDLWVIDFAGETPSWTQIAEQPTWPAPRYHHASVALPTQSALVIVGGKSHSEESPDDLLWIWEHKKQSWQSQPSELSASRYGHSLTLLSPTKICLVGGATIVDPNAEGTKAAAGGSLEVFTRSIILDEEHANEASAELDASKGRRTRNDSLRGGGRERKNSRAVARGSVSALVATYSPIPSPVATPPVTAPQPSTSAQSSEPSSKRESLNSESSVSEDTGSIADSLDDPTSDRTPSEHDQAIPEPDQPDQPISEHNRIKLINHIQESLPDRDPVPLSPHEPMEPVGIISPIKPIEPVREVDIPFSIAPSNDLASPFDDMPDSPVPPPPEEESTEPTPTVISTNNSHHSTPTAAASNSAVNEQTQHQSADASISQNPAVAPINPAAAAMKRAGGSRMRSARISMGHTGFLNMLVTKPGNAEWIDFMDSEQLRIELKALTNFVYNVKGVLDAETTTPAEETLQTIRSLYANELPKFTPPAVVRNAPNGETTTQDADGTNSQPSSSKFSIALTSPTNAPAPHFPHDSQSSDESPASPTSPNSTSSANVESNDISLTRSAPVPISAIPHTFTSATPSSPAGSGKLWGASASPGSGRERDSLFLSHRASVMLGPATTLPNASSSPPTTSDSALRIGSRGSLSLGNSPIPSPAPEGTMSPSSSSSALSSSVPSSSLQRSGSATPPGALSPSSSASNLAKSPSTDSVSKRSTIVVKEFDLSSTAEKQAAMVESQLDASYSIPTTSCPDTEQSRRDREYAVQELLDTESKYVRDLNLIVEHFQKPLQANGILNARQIQDIFSIIKDFIPLHEQLLKELSETVKKPDAEQCPGQIFLAMADYLKMYTGFCASQTNIAQRISDLTKSNSSFRKFLDARLKDEKLRGLTLTAFLVMPIQRVCRFPLLLKQIAKSTPVTHQDFKKLHLGIFKVDKVVMAVNEGKRLLEAQAQMYELEQNLAWDKQKAPANFVFIDPSRRLVLQETHVEWLSKSSKEKSELIHVLLFNDLLLLARPKEGTTQRKIRRAFALVTTNVGIDDSLDASTGKSTLQITFGDETINLAFQSKEKRSEMQLALSEAKQKIPDSAAVRETIDALEAYHSQH